MNKYTITGTVYQADKKKTGEPYIGKFGPFFRITFKVTDEKYAGKWISINSKNKVAWTDGTVIEGTIEEKDGFLNFHLPKKDDAVNEEISKLRREFTTLNLSVERRIEEKFAELKSQLVLQLTGKFQTDVDAKAYNAPHPLMESADDFANVPDGEIDF